MRRDRSQTEQNHGDSSAGESSKEALHVRRSTHLHTLQSQRRPSASLGFILAVSNSVERSTGSGRKVPFWQLSNDWILGFGCDPNLDSNLIPKDLTIPAAATIQRKLQLEIWLRASPFELPDLAIPPAIQEPTPKFKAQGQPAYGLR